MENNDKVKKILFGNKNLPDNPETKMNEEALSRWTKKDTKNAIENLEFIKPDDLAFDSPLFDGKRFDFSKPETSQPVASENPDSQALENITRKLNDAGVPVTNPDEVWEQVKGKMIRAQQDQESIEDIKETVKDRMIEIAKDAAEMNAIRAYCKEQGITPLDLIEQHSYWATACRELLDEYDAEKKATAKEAGK